MYTILLRQGLTVRFSTHWLQAEQANFPLNHVDQVYSCVIAYESNTLLTHTKLASSVASLLKTAFLDLHE